LRRSCSAAALFGNNRDAMGLKPDPDRCSRGKKPIDGQFNNKQRTAGRLGFVFDAFAGLSASSTSP
jgi:hypothetical protein